ncbi:MAG: transposase [Pirellulales bacterium]|nr:transposase [Pirellulales bacterium]
MGEAQGRLFEPTFNRSVKVVATDDRITSDAGMLLLREADHRLGVTEALAGELHDPRRQELIRYKLVELKRLPRSQSVKCQSIDPPLTSNR